MNIIYSPRGNAREYGALACSVYLRCTFACTYCYCPEALHVSREDYHQKPEPRPLFLEKLTKDAAKLKGSKEPVFLSFVGDCYQPAEEEYELTRQAIKILHAQDIPVNILTKGGLRAMRDFDLLGPGDQFGVTLTCAEDDVSRKWEPGAALPSDRITSLMVAKSKGIKTWASLEPILNPVAAKWLIEATFPVVDCWRVGKMNHLELPLDWAQVALDLKETLDKVGARYYFKAGLAAHLGQDAGFWGGPDK